MLLTLRRLIEEVSDAAGLDQAARLIVERVQASMGTDVSTIYLVDPRTGEQVLIATQGLNPESVGLARLEQGEGVVGLVAEREEPVNLEDAARHPRFKYLPETGESAFHSFLGVPLIHGGKVLGVLAVQQRVRRRFSPDEEAFLLTVGAQLAGFIAHALASGWLLDGSSPLGSGSELAFHGQPGSPGAGIGVVVSVDPPADLHNVPDRTTDDADREAEAFDRALASTREELHEAEQRLGPELPEAERALFLAYRLMLEGESFADEVRDRIRSGMWAPGALRATISEHERNFAQIDDPYLRERGQDVHDLAARVLAHLEGRRREPRDYPDRTVLAGSRLSVVELAEVPRERLAAIISTGGSATSHVSVFARSLGIPAVVGAEDLPLGQLDGTEVAVDGYAGTVIATPGAATRERFERVMEEAAALDASLAELRDLPMETPDGHRVQVMADLASVNTMDPYDRCGAVGVGLFRTEYAFMTRQIFPTEDEQRAMYETLLSAIAPAPVTLRTLDIGADKKLPYFPIDEPNPALGWRGIRVSLDHPEILLTQVRAMMRANAVHGNLRVLLPMVTTLEEVDRTLALLRRAHLELAEEGFEVPFPEVGAMVEVPSVVYQAGALAERLDFLAIGANDLTQYVLAVDRGNARVARLFDSLHPSVIASMQHVVRSAGDQDCIVGLCGTMAADPAAAVFFPALGFDYVSAVAPGVARVKAVVRGLSLERSRELLDEALRLDGPREVRQLARRALEDVGLAKLIGPME